MEIRPKKKMEIWLKPINEIKWLRPRRLLSSFDSFQQEAKVISRNKEKLNILIHL